MLIGKLRTVKIAIGRGFASHTGSNAIKAQKMFVQITRFVLTFGWALLGKATLGSIWKQEN
jgi:hypothetical protein